WTFLLLQCGIGLLILLQFNRFAILLGLASLAPVAIYPFMKR
ncbi:MAG TPA: 4-hydroxybenzoate octaprenyltransferase, partial [Alphaproteobacteria bacterium]|nr:4-hydroxybenzoate octaprenyltransferase [Alphaproteobacteria bacterium]